MIRLMQYSPRQQIASGAFEPGALRVLGSQRHRLRRRDFRAEARDTEATLLQGLAAFGTNDLGIYQYDLGAWIPLE